MKAKAIFKKILKVLFRRILPLFLLLIAGVTLYSVISSKLSGNQMAMPFGYGIGYPMSGSMEPTLDVEDLIVVKKADSYKVGDIVVYSGRNSLIVHRIIDIQTMTYREYEENHLDGAISEPIIENKGQKPNDPNREVIVVTTKGDWEGAAVDTPILDSKIQGKVIHVIDGGRIMVDILQSPIVTIVAGGIAIYLLQASFKRQKKEDSDELAALEAEIKKLSAEKDEDKSYGDANSVVKSSTDEEAIAKEDQNSEDVSKVLEGESNFETEKNKEGSTAE